MPSEPPVPACEAAPLWCHVWLPFSFTVKVCSLPVFLARVHALVPDAEGSGCKRRDPTGRWQKLSSWSRALGCILPPGGWVKLSAHLRGCFSPGESPCEQRRAPLVEGQACLPRCSSHPRTAGFQLGSPPPRRGRGFYCCGSFSQHGVSVVTLLCRGTVPLTCSGETKQL